MRGANDNRFSPADVKRAIKAARDAGQSVAALDFPKGNYIFDSPNRLGYISTCESGIGR